MTDATLPKGTICVSGSFEIIEVLGSGATATVYRARQKSMERLVALKVINKQVGDERATARFKREAQALAKLRHRNIVEIFAIGASDGAPYLSMELVDGMPLKELIGTGLPINRCLDLVSQIASGLAHAHRNGIVHRDLKPPNVIVTNDQCGNEIAKIVDFGLVKMMDTAADEGAATSSASVPALTQENAPLGTPSYMSPEQCQGLTADARSDIYSLGCIMFELLTGDSLFNGTSLEVMMKQVHEPPELDRVENLQLRNILRRALQKNQMDRYQSVEQFASEIETLGRSEGGSEQNRSQPPNRKPVSAFFRRFEGKELIIATTTAVVLAVLVLGTALLALSHWSATRNRQEDPAQIRRNAMILMASMKKAGPTRSLSDSELGYAEATLKAAINEGKKSKENVVPLQIQLLEVLIRLRPMSQEPIDLGKEVLATKNYASSIDVERSNKSATCSKFVTLLCMRNDFDKAKETTDTFVASKGLPPFEKAWVQFALGQAFFGSHRYVEAENYLLSAFTNSKRDEKNFLHRATTLAECQSNLKHLDAALQTYQTARNYCTTDFERAGMDIGIACVYEVQQKLDLSIRHYNKALSEGGSDQNLTLRASLGLAQCYWAKDDERQADKWFKQAVHCLHDVNANGSHDDIVVASFILPFYADFLTAHHRDAEALAIRQRIAKNVSAGAAHQ
jgi:tRNA A-37 threonylcarbamoyl transferase component Bud32/tetratricopeptide (TPR) repeat protein